MNWYEIQDSGRERHRALLDEAAWLRTPGGGQRITARARVAAALIALGQRLAPADEQGASIAGVQPAHAES